MLILTTFETLPTITASSSDSQHPVSNVAVIDPGRTWQPSTYTAMAPAWIVVDFGAAKSLDSVFLNNCNFAAAAIQGNDTDVWTSPAFDESVTLAFDDAKVRKGFFTLTAFNYRYLRLFVDFQTLDASAIYPFVGNLICGTAQQFKVSEWVPTRIKRYSTFTSDGGSYKKTRKGIIRHTFAVSQSSTLSQAESIDWDWDIAVVYTNLNSVADSWLVYSPAELSKPMKSILQVDSRFTLEECV